MISLKEEEDNFQIKVKDNGIGYDQAEAERKERHFGLAVVRERVFFIKWDNRSSYGEWNQHFY